MSNTTDVTSMSVDEIKNSLSKMGIALPSRRTTKEQLIDLYKESVGKGSIQGKTSCPVFPTSRVDEGNNFLDLIKSGRPSLQPQEKDPSPFKKRLSETPSNLMPIVNQVK